ncbi:MAG: hypothetical protein PHT77_11465 [Bacteroidales bacterium]|nr:hypothetical protein [Clostridia bacterium]MDD3962466.1 hypothetical protein [Bacteroidales bacterium]
MIEQLLIDQIRRRGVEAVAEDFLLKGKDSFEYKIKHGIPMTKMEERKIRYRQKVGIALYTALLGPCDGKRTPELAVENLMKLIRKHPYWRNFIEFLLSIYWLFSKFCSIAYFLHLRSPAQ